MSLSPALLAAGLSGSHELALALVAAAFIVFALVSSFVVPRRSPNFPGDRVGLYVGVAFLFFVGMIAAVIVLGKERPKASAAPRVTTVPKVITTEASPTTTPAAPATKGDPVAGKQVFDTAGCSGCHTLKAAGATGTVGPNLDQLKPAEQIVVHQVENGGGVMPAFKGQLSPTQIQNVAAFVYTSTH